MRASWIYIASLAAHGGLAVGIAALRPGRTTENVSIAIVERKKQDAPPPPPPPAPLEAPKARTKEPSTKTTSTPKTVEAVSETPSATGGDAPDFGISLTGGSGAGMALPSGNGPAKPAASVAPTRKVLTKPKEDECTEPLVKAKPKNKPTASYTTAARDANITGVVRVEITIDETGKVIAARVLEGLGHGLDEAALEADKLFEFEPATLCGKPVASKRVVPNRFEP